MRNLLINLSLTVALLAIATLFAIVCGATVQGVAATVILLAFAIGITEGLHWLYQFVSALRGWTGFLQ